MVVTLPRRTRAITLAALACSTLSLPGSALAQPLRRPAQAAPPSSGSKRPGPLIRSDFIRATDLAFSKMDADGNGQVTQSEIESSQNAAAGVARARNRLLFDRLDVDHDGQVSPSEFAALTPKRPTADGGPMLARMDSNGDHKISLVEHRTATLAEFDKLDFDKDGSVTTEEMRVGTGGARF